jgi:hypothetical protein
MHHRSGEIDLAQALHQIVVARYRFRMIARVLGIDALRQGFNYLVRPEMQEERHRITRPIRCLAARVDDAVSRRA